MYSENQKYRDFFVPVLGGDVITEKTNLKIYVTGDSPTSRTAIQNLRALCAQCASPWSLEVIDVKANPDAARNAHILVTPTVIKNTPQSTRRFVGDISEAEYVMTELGIEISSPH